MLKIRWQIFRNWRWNSRCFLYQMHIASTVLWSSFGVFTVFVIVFLVTIELECWLDRNSYPKCSILDVWQGSRYPTCIYLLKVNNRNTGTRCEICSKLTIKTADGRYWRRTCNRRLDRPLKSVFLEFLDFKGKVLFFYTTLLHRLRHSKPWSKTRRLWGNAWWEMHHSFLGAKLLVSIKSCNNF